MSFSDIKVNWLEEAIVPAIDLLYSIPTDRDLIQRNANERTIVANIYCKVNSTLNKMQNSTKELGNLSVDIEYNRNYLDSKRVYKKCEFCHEEGCLINQLKPDPTTSAPDMIIHQRGENADNQVVIEFKMTSNKVKEERLSDEIKLIYYTCQQPFSYNEEKNYQYRIGYFIELDIDRYSVTTYQDTDSDKPRSDEPRSRQGGIWL